MRFLQRQAVGRGQAVLCSVWPRRRSAISAATSCGNMAASRQQLVDFGRRQEKDVLRALEAAVGCQALAHLEGDAPQATVEERLLQSVRARAGQMQALVQPQGQPA